MARLTWGKKRLQLGRQQSVLLGRGDRAQFRIPAKGVSELHAKFECQGGRFFIEDLNSETGTFVDGRRLEAGRREEIYAGSSFRLGPVEMRLEAGASGVPAEPGAAAGLTLRAWRARADVPAPDADGTWSSAAEHLVELRQSTQGQSGIRTLRTRPLRPAVLASWIEGLYAERFGTAALPVCLSVVIDLARLVIHQPPVFLEGSQVAGNPLVRRLQDLLLLRLATLPATTFIRDRLDAARKEDATDPEREAAVAGRFVVRVLDWLARTWIEVDVAGHLQRLDGLTYPATADQVRAAAAKARGLPGDFEVPEPDSGAFRSERELAAVLEVEDLGRCAGVRCFLDAGHAGAFLADLLRIVEARSRFQGVISPIERFLMGAASRVRQAYELADDALITACLASTDLDDLPFRIEPIRLDPERPEVLSRRPDEHMDLRRVRATTELRRLPDTIPQELMLVASGPQGTNRFLHKLLREGILVWDRQEHVREVHRKRFLVCFVADIGPEAKKFVDAGPAAEPAAARRRIAGTGPAAPPAAQGVTPDIHGRRLIFDCLRDIARFVDLPGIEFTLRVFCEPVCGDGTDVRLAYETTLESFRQIADDDRTGCMTSFESRAPGYFFRLNPDARGRPETWWEFADRMESLGPYDLRLFVLLGPASTVATHLIPDVLPGVPDGSRQKTIVRLVTLGRSTERVATTTSAGFHQATLADGGKDLDDAEIRVAVIEDILGACLDAQSRTKDLVFGDAAP